ncbi:MAG: 2-phospho-L-lactate guanylyltransferase [Pelotomaculum sp. PtaB.Bin104]|nr:MAG: 2-phospho-L-lactate guanylyltransferase [Pelotomaculum sp. PtaB.Bin104]
MDKPALAIMTRVPSPEGKSRLGELLTPEQREDLQWVFLLEAIKKTRRLPGFKCFVAATPPEQIEKLGHLPGCGRLEIIPQPAGDLGRRMMTVARQLHRRGYKPVILIGTDTPELPPEFILEAAQLLQRHHLVLGPSFDGGYYLIGLSAPEDRVFQGISWGTGSVLEQTLSICHQNKLTYYLLEPLRDIDRPDDLRALAGENRQRALEQHPLPAKIREFLANLT